MKPDRPKGGEVIPIRPLSDRAHCEDILSGCIADLNNSKALAERAKRFRTEARFTLGFAFLLLLAALIVAAATHTH